MDRYWKAVVAAAGVIVQIAAAVGAANAVPEAWRPWVNVVVAIATAVLVYRVPNEPMEGGKHRAGVTPAATSDAGRARLVVLLPVVVLVLLAVGMPPAVAAIRHHEEHAARRPSPAAAAVVDPVLLSALPVCEGKTLISYRLDQYDPATRAFVQADGPPPGVEAWLDGAWRPEPATAGDAAGTIEISDRRAFRIRLVAASGPGVPGTVQELVHCG